MKQLSGDNKLCPMCHFIYEVTQLKMQLLRKCLVSYNNIELYERMDDATCIDIDTFFKRVDIIQSNEEWKVQLTKTWNLKLEAAIREMIN